MNREAAKLFHSYLHKLKENGFWSCVNPSEKVCQQKWGKMTFFVDAFLITFEFSEKCQKIDPGQEMSEWSQITIIVNPFQRHWKERRFISNIFQLDKQFSLARFFATILGCTYPWLFYTEKKKLCSSIRFTCAKYEAVYKKIDCTLSIYAGSNP